MQDEGEVCWCGIGGVGWGGGWLVVWVGGVGGGGGGGTRVSTAHLSQLKQITSTLGKRMAPDQEGDKGRLACVCVCVHLCTCVSVCVGVCVGGGGGLYHHLCRQIHPCCAELSVPTEVSACVCVCGGGVALGCNKPFSSGILGGL